MQETKLAQLLRLVEQTEYKEAGHKLLVLLLSLIYKLITYRIPKLKKKLTEILIVNFVKKPLTIKKIINLFPKKRSFYCK